MTNISRLAAAVLASAFLASSALAQTATPPAKTATTAAKTEKKAAKPRSTASLECSKQADEKGLHGKERKKFRAECIKSAKAGTAGEKAK